MLIGEEKEKKKNIIVNNILYFKLLCIQVLFLNRMESIKEDNKLTEEEEKNHFDPPKLHPQHKEYVSQKVLDIFGKLENLID